MLATSDSPAGELSTRIRKFDKVSETSPRAWIFSTGFTRWPGSEREGAKLPRLRGVARPRPKLIKPRLRRGSYRILDILFILSKKNTSLNS